MDSRGWKEKKFNNTTNEIHKETISTPVITLLIHRFFKNKSSAILYKYSFFLLSKIKSKKFDSFISTLENIILLRKQKQHQLFNKIQLKIVCN